jgi:hypothetical protein
VLAEAALAAKPLPALEPLEALAPPAPLAALHHLNKRPPKLRRKERLRELQQFYYGHAVTKHNRSLGLVRRRVGRGGRVVLDRFNGHLLDRIGDSDLSPPQTNNHPQMFSFNFSKL